MKNLAAYYRPQTFAQVAGQSLVTTVLSRAAAEDKVAPAYLLSGTRGVGKTTIARILAKALNCVHAPTGEPCNECEQCRKITQGNHVDVTEIDGASNNSVEDARALREHIGYAPMEGRYKVFIIDEAHMLSRSAFNALLKTLEEPPPRVVFIFATTEAHKFPITIVSRCQHFIFKRLPEAELVAHLTRVLQKEEMPFDPLAVRLLARRAAGSVRDGMSLLGQTLALGGDSLTVEATRNVLGLAGQDMFFRLVAALHQADFTGIAAILREILDQGADITYFLREFTALWRTLFLIQQSGAAVLSTLDVPDDELPQWQALAGKFSLAHIHAAWHMVLESQRKVIQCPEPAAALELLLFNVALLPRLLPLGNVQGTPPASVTPAVAETTGTPPAPAPDMAGSNTTPTPTNAADKAPDTIATPAPAVTSPPDTAAMTEPSRRASTRPPVRETAPETPTPATPTASVTAVEAPVLPSSRWRAAVQQGMRRQPQDAATAAPSALSGVPPSPAQNTPTAPPRFVAPRHAGDDAPADDERPAPATESTFAAPAGVSPEHTEEDDSPAASFWREICTQAAAQHIDIPHTIALRNVRPTQEGDSLLLATELKSVYQKLVPVLPQLSEVASQIAGRPVSVAMQHDEPQCRTEAQLVQDFSLRPEFAPCLEILDARLLTVRPKQ